MTLPGQPEPFWGRSTLLPECPALDLSNPLTEGQKLVGGYTFVVLNESGRPVNLNVGRGCSAEEARAAQDFFGPRMAKVNGGPRNLAQLLETIRLCEARKKIQQPDLVQFFQLR